jgi:hypothetical protein
MISFFQIQEVDIMPSESDWQDRAKRFLKAELKRADVTYEDLALKLADHGMPGETKASIANKLSRGAFPATFLLAVATVIGIEVIKLEEM